MPRRAEPDDLHRFRIPTDPAISPDGALIAFTLQAAAPRRDGYRHSLWSVPADGSGPARQLAAAGRHDRHGRFSPDGRVLAFLSDRPGPEDGDGETQEGAGPSGRPGAAEPERRTQVHLLPMHGGEARRLTNHRFEIADFAWSPDGRRLVLIAADGPRLEAAPGEAGPPPSDYRYIDRLAYMRNGEGFRHDRVAQLWIVDVETGRTRQVTRGRTDAGEPAWSPDGTRIAFAADRSRDFDLVERSDVFVVDVESGRETRITGGERAVFHAPAWLPDGRTLAVIGHRLPAGGGSRGDLWLFAADGSDAGADGGRNLTGRHDLMLGAGMASDVTPGEGAGLRVDGDGRWISFIAPDRGAAELWRAAPDDGRVERLSEGRHCISAFDLATMAGGTRYAAIRSDATTVSEVEVLDVPATRSGGGRGTRAGAGGSGLRRVTNLNADVLAELDLVEPHERWTEVDGRQIQGWFFPPRGAAAGRRAPLVAQIHGGPHAYYGWSPFWEFQVLAGAGMAVYASNPRGSEGYGQDFNAANHRDWGPGPMRDVIAGVEALVDEGLADAERLGVTGGSYGGYLTTWIVAHDQRFRAALTARSVSDVAMLMLTGDISGPEFGMQEFGVTPWSDPAYYREISPLTYAANIRTPLLIQHAEQDIRTTVGQAEALFTVLRSLRRPVRLMRVPDENHELTRSGTPFRRVEYLVQVRDWFDHFLVRGRRGMPPAPKPGARSRTRR